MSETFIIITCTDSTQGNSFQGLPFLDIKNEALGKDYELELVFISEEESQKLNLVHKQKDKPTNILSFPLSENSGQMFICPEYAKKEAPEFDRTFENYLVFLFIHGVIHLKGFDHGSRMENEEQKLRSKFGV